MKIEKNPGNVENCPWCDCAPELIVNFINEKTTSYVYQCPQCHKTGDSKYYSGKDHTLNEAKNLSLYTWNWFAKNMKIMLTR